MSDSLRYPLPGTHPLVVGAARSGLAAARLLRRLGLEPRLADRRFDGPEGAALTRELGAQGIAAALVADGPEALAGSDFVVWSPGIPIDHPLARAARVAGVPVLSEFELGWRASPARFVCVTGTNGKSTTTDLIGALARTVGVPVAVCGNIGTPVCDVAPALPAAALVVAEVSSFQLETVDRLRPDVAVWLNLTPDHLDRHGSFEMYGGMKRRLFLRQGAGDVAVWNSDDAEVMKRRIPEQIPAAPAAREFSTRGPVDDGAFAEGGDVVMASRGSRAPLLPVAELRLRGRHNLMNALAALCAARAVGVSDAAAREVLTRYPGLEHRLESVTTVEGVEFVNDSKATNVASLEVALESFERPVVLIAGGRDKGQDFRPLAERIRRAVAHLVLIGEGAPRLAQAWPDVPTFVAPTLAVAVDAAFERARPIGAPVLLSPGCASFDMFRDFEDRGRQFKAEVERLARAGVA
jgi:UDP-N-acetylmuramoylalanine--D-glutamate ligase